MRIIGGHDYYDCALSLGIDPSIVLVRSKSNTLPSKELYIPTMEVRAFSRNGRGIFSFRDDNINPVTVVFCSKVYNGIEVKHNFTGRSEHIWSLPKFLEWQKAHPHTKLQIGGYRELLQKHKGKDSELWRQFFTPQEVSADLREYMIRHRFSILVQTTTSGALAWQTDFKVAVNPFTLHKLEFAKALDPFTAFQELSMWIGGVLGGASPEVVHIKDDKVLAESHGFDKFSFRGARIR